jgi:hypothetical protein
MSFVTGRTFNADIIGYVSPRSVSGAPPLNRNVAGNFALGFSFLTQQMHEVRGRFNVSELSVSAIGLASFKWDTETEGDPYVIFSHMLDVL